MTRARLLKSRRMPLVPGWPRVAHLPLKPSIDRHMQLKHQHEILDSASRPNRPARRGRHLVPRDYRHRHLLYDLLQRPLRIKIIGAHSNLSTCATMSPSLRPIALRQVEMELPYWLSELKQMEWMLTVLPVGPHRVSADVSLFEVCSQVTIVL